MVGAATTRLTGSDHYGAIRLIWRGVVYQTAHPAIKPVNTLIATSFNTLKGSGSPAPGATEYQRQRCRVWSIFVPDAAIISYSSTSFTFTGVSMR